MGTMEPCCNDPAVDDLQLDDEWAKFFRTIGTYDFRYELNVDVLGHLFEKSINDIEKVRLGGLFETGASEGVSPKMAKSPSAKKGGIYYTPPEFTRFITHHTVAVIAGERIDAIAHKYKGRSPRRNETAWRGRKRQTVC